MYAYNAKLSADRAAAVVAALKERYHIAAGRLQPHGVGPLSPVFSNGQDTGKEKNRRVELVER
jgi:outer membrane protein OmpA-like peptidoglycan-associated protein